jgi:hypothetical protein
MPRNIDLEPASTLAMGAEGLGFLPGVTACYALQNRGGEIPKISASIGFHQTEEKALKARTKVVEKFKGKGQPLAADLVENLQPVWLKDGQEYTTIGSHKVKIHRCPSR